LLVCTSVGSRISNTRTSAPFAGLQQTVRTSVGATNTRTYASFAGLQQTFARLWLRHL